MVRTKKLEVRANAMLTFLSIARWGTNGSWCLCSAATYAESILRIAHPNSNEYYKGTIDWYFFLLCAAKNRVT